MKQKEKLNKWVVLWSAIGVGIILGILYVWSVISKGLQDELGWLSTQASLPYTMFSVFLAIGFLIAGLIQDRIGPRYCIVACAVLMGIGLVLSGVFTTPWMVVLGFGVICGSGVGSGVAASLAPALKWFPSAKKGMVSGAVLAGIGFSAVIYSPVSDVLLGSVGVSKTFIIFGAVAFVLMFLLSFNMKDPPPGFDKESGRFLQEGETVKTRDSGQPAANAAPAENDVTTKNMLKTGMFYLIFAIYALSTASGLMIIAHAAPIARTQAGWEGGFVLVIVMNLLNTAGRFFGGSISDKIGRTNTFKLTFAVQAVNMILFRFYNNIPLMLVGILVQGFCYGTIFAVMPSLTADLYGLKSFGANYGCLFLAWGIGGIIGPMMAASVFDATRASGAAGNYYLSYIIACALSVVSLILVFVLHRLRAVKQQ